MRWAARVGLLVVPVLVLIVYYAATPTACQDAVTTSGVAQVCQPLGSGSPPMVAVWALLGASAVLARDPRPDVTALRAELAAVQADIDHTRTRLDGLR